MSSLTKRVDALEQADGKGNVKNLWVTYASDGGFVYGGKLYADTDALLHALGIEQDEVCLIGWTPGLTAAELLASASEKSHLPEASLDDLGKYGRQLADKGVSPAVAKYLETLQPCERGTS